jgi:predicted AlkP superfamily phosphohydrolase/phosphomutase
LSAPGKGGRVVVVGVDSVPLDLILPWAQKGYLPNFAKIFGKGAYGDLYSRIPVTPVAWSTIYTGKNPGKHGIIGFRNHKPNTYEESPVNSTIRDARDVWEIAGAQGKRVVVVNTPLTYPPRPANGSLICGFMAPGTDYEFTYPASLGEEIKRVVPGYRIGTAPTYMKHLYLKELHSTVQVVGEAAVHLMKKTDWDLSFVVFKETDEVQHSFYDRLPAVLGLYRRVDKFVGQFMELAGEGAYFFVVSDHGGEPINKRFNVAEYLRRQGLIKLRQGERKRASAALQVVASALFGLKLEWMLDVPGVRRMLKQVMMARGRQVAKRGKGEGGDEGFYAGAVDWENTKAFISSGIGLRVNLKGREPMGAVEPEDYRAVIEEISRQFSDVRDPENGMTVFRYAKPKEEVLSGPHLDIAPDVLCLPNTGYLPTEALASFDPLAVVAANRSLFSRGSLWCGTHSPYGVIAASGPGIAMKTFSGATLDDVAPTVLYALGLPVPNDMDGKVLSQAFEAEYLSRNPVVWEEVEEGPKTKARSLSDEEEQIVTERLKALGYLS